MTPNALLDDLDRQLIQAACEVRERAYAKYSQFLVGAALLGEDGRIHRGCNVENISFGLTSCAERNAVFAGIAAGCRRFTRLALATRGGVTPCGACRQVLAEFAEDLAIVIVDVVKPEVAARWTLRELLPGQFDSLGD